MANSTLVQPRGYPCPVGRTEYPVLSRVVTVVQPPVLSGEAPEMTKGCPPSLTELGQDRTRVYHLDRTREYPPY